MADRRAFLDGESPLDCPPQIRALLYAGYFRSAAKDFRALAPEWSATLLYPPAKGVVIQERVGTLIIEAHRFGLLPNIPGLGEMVDQHTKPAEPLPAGRQAQRLPCPVNLFLDLAGGDMIRGTLFVQPDGRKIVIPEKDERGRVREVGGLVPALAPGHRAFPKPERHALVCEWLAQLVEAGVQPSTPAATRPEPAQTSAPPIRPRKTTISARMIDTLAKKPDAVGWTARKWASFLKCSASAIVITATWKALTLQQENDHAERRRDRRRRPRHYSAD